MSDELTILCFRTGRPDFVLVDGAMKAKCGQCGHEVWISPSSLRMMSQAAHGKALIACEVCCRELMKTSEEPIQILPLNQDQVDEIKEAMANLKRRN